ncbi:MAG: leucine-rich repeat domain-containing protein [Saprospiraceae bacterium]
MHKYYFSILIILSTVTYLNAQNYWGSRATDSLALVQLYEATNGGNWRVKWDFDQPMEQWFGVTLHEFGRVKCIDLDGIPDCGFYRDGGNFLQGALPDLNLPFLEHLFLANNLLKGRIPDFNHLPFLLTLQLAGNRLTEELPDFSQLPRLQTLDLEYNQLVGMIPDFSESKNLENLYLGHNQLSGELPDFYYLSNLLELYLVDNQLVGEISDFADCLQLKRIILSQNQFTGELPDYSQHQNLAFVDVSHNALTGCSLDFAHPDFILKMWGNQLVDCDLTDLFIPSAFSPNGDGINDVLTIGKSKNATQEGLAIQVLDWQGRAVYTSTNYQNDWQGQSQKTGKTLPNGTYLLMIQTSKGGIKRQSLTIKR